MTREARRFRVALAPGAGPADEPRDVELGSDGEIVTRIDDGTVIVRGRDGIERTAVIGASRQMATGVVRAEVVVDGWRFELDVEDAVRATLRRRATRAVDADLASGPAEIRAIISGRVAAVRATAGDAVEAGQTLLVVEAMKMQNELRAARAGTVERVAVGEGDTIDAGDLLVVVR
jgi:biotin carboxyl carrier protein